MKLPRRPILFTTLGLAAMAAIVATVVTNPDLPNDVVLQLTSGTHESSADSTDPGAFESPEKREASATAPAGGASNEGTSEGTGSNSGSGSGSGGSNSPGTGTSASETGASIKIRILWWNDTVEKRPADFEIRFGTQSIKPDVSKVSGTASIGPCVVGKQNTLVVYPDGRDGKRLEVPFTANKDMVSDTDVDAIHVEMSDGKVRVLGNSVLNFEHSFSRF